MSNNKHSYNKHKKQNIINNVQGKKTCGHEVLKADIPPFKILQIPHLLSENKRDTLYYTENLSYGLKDKTILLICVDDINDGSIVYLIYIK